MIKILVRTKISNMYRSPLCSFAMQSQLLVQSNQGVHYKENTSFQYFVKISLYKVLSSHFITKMK